MDEKQRFSSSLGILRVTMSLLVIYVHTRIPCIDSGYIAFQSYIQRIVCACAVPVFFAISAYLFFYNLGTWDWDKYTAKLKKRFKSLFIPYAGWILFSVAIVLFTSLRSYDSLISWLSEHGYWHIFWDSERSPSVSVNFLGMAVPGNITPLSVHLWYLRDLMVMVVLSPALYWILKKTKIWGVVLLMLYFIAKFTDIYPGLTCSAWAFFGWGAYLSMNGKNLFSGNRRLLIGAVAVSLTLAVILWFLPTSNNYYVHIRAIFCVAATGTVMNMAYAFSGKIRMPGWLVSATMFIYCAHPFLLALCVYPLLKRLYTASDVLSAYILFLTLPVAVLFLCAFVHNMTHRITGLLRR